MLNSSKDIKYINMIQCKLNYDEITIKYTNFTINIANYFLIIPLSPYV